MVRGATGRADRLASGRASLRRTTGDGSILAGPLEDRSGRTGGRRTTCTNRSTTTSFRSTAALLDAEDLAFDELEHACEEGDRRQFDKDMIDWQNALEHKLVFLHQRRHRGTAARHQLSPLPARRMRQGAAP